MKTGWLGVGASLCGVVHDVKGFYPMSVEIEILEGLRCNSIEQLDLKGLLFLPPPCVSVSSRGSPFSWHALGIRKLREFQTYAHGTINNRTSRLSPGRHPDLKR